MEILRFMKHADKERNRIILPKFIIDKFGRNFYLEVNTNDGTMKLIPIKNRRALCPLFKEGDKVCVVVGHGAEDVCEARACTLGKGGFGVILL